MYSEVVDGVYSSTGLTLRIEPTVECYTFTCIDADECGGLWDFEVDAAASTWRDINRSAICYILEQSSHIDYVVAFEQGRKSIWRGNAKCSVCDHFLDVFPDVR